MQDLDGYWDACVAPQISELESRFESCDDLRSNQWVIETSDEPAAPKKRRMKKATRKAGQAAGAGKADTAEVRPSTRAFLAEMRQKKRQTVASNGSHASPQIIVAAAPKRMAMDTEDDEAQHSCKRFGLAGMTVAQGKQLLTPVRASKRDQDTLGSAVYMTPVRRSARKVRSVARGEQGERRGRQRGSIKKSLGSCIILAHSFIVSCHPQPPLLCHFVSIISLPLS